MKPTRLDADGRSDRSTGDDSSAAHVAQEPAVSTSRVAAIETRQASPVAVQGTPARDPKTGGKTGRVMAMRARSETQEAETVVDVTRAVSLPTYATICDAARRREGPASDARETSWVHLFVLSGEFDELSEELSAARTELHRACLAAEPSTGDRLGSSRVLAEMQKLLDRIRLVHTSIARFTTMQREARESANSRVMAWCAMAKQGVEIPVSEKQLLLTERHKLIVANQLLVTAYTSLLRLQQALLDAKRRQASHCCYTGDVLNASKRVLAIEATIVAHKKR